MAGMLYTHSPCTSGYGSAVYWDACPVVGYANTFDFSNVYLDVKWETESFGHTTKHGKFIMVVPTIMEHATAMRLISKVVDAYIEAALSG